MIKLCAIYRKRMSPTSKTSLRSLSSQREYWQQQEYCRVVVIAIPFSGTIRFFYQNVPLLDIDFAAAQYKLSHNSYYTLGGVHIKGIEDSVWVWYEPEVKSVGVITRNMEFWGCPGDVAAVSCFRAIDISWSY